MFDQRGFVEMVIQEGLSDIRPLIAHHVAQRADILAADARDMMRNGEKRGSDIMVERGEQIASIVIAARWWAAEWRTVEMLKATVADIREWAMVNEIGATPLDWAGLGNILRTLDQDQRGGHR